MKKEKIFSSFGILPQEEMRYLAVKDIGGNHSQCIIKEKQLMFWRMTST